MKGTTRSRVERATIFIVGYYGDAPANNIASDTDDLNGGPGDDTLVGDGLNDSNLDAASDVLRGGDGDDVLYGDSRSEDLSEDTSPDGVGEDRIFGEAGNDVIDGQGSDDRCLGGSGNNTLRRCERP